VVNLKTAKALALGVSHQLELGRELHRQFARLGAAQDAVDVSGDAARRRRPSDPALSGAGCGDGN
jgi:hypothetical protein